MSLNLINMRDIIYFTKSDDSKKMGIEHTHPPMEYIFR